PTWRAHALQEGMEQMLVDGLVAYWVYQGWGNIGASSGDEYELLAIMQQAAQSGEDALESLRTRIRRAVYQEATLQWHYEIQTMPPVFVADVRADRPARLAGIGSMDDAPRIMSREQMAQLCTWMRDHDASTAVLVSSVPAILPPLIGFAEYIAGVRPFQARPAGLRHRFGSMLAGAQQKLMQRMSFDHWPVFGATWRELVELLDARRNDLVILSGDVHFSYNMSARRSARKRRAVLYQLVSTPFKNTLEQRDKRLVVGQAWLKQAIYGGLRSRVLPLMWAKGGRRVPSDMLFQNVVALVTFWPQARNEGGYDIRQVYLGVQGETLVEVAVCDVHYSE
ncbi:MAG TPA: hypothetical protein VGT44_16970, partial [Ktedonobacteraceae bacterium]|nr:hypothetical protein [Ktedonobacteraceae bacterium]